jgi:uncharacterized protein YndB with AHSA1/START domain
MYSDDDLENTKRVDRADRIIAADAAEIYRAFVSREAIVKWLPPKGASATLEAFEPRVGGTFRMKLVFTGPHVQGKTNEDTDVVDGIFEQLVPGQLVTQRFKFVSDNPDFAGSMTMCWRLEREGDGTHVTVSAENVPRGISPADHKKGMESSLENLASYLARR